MFKKMVVLTAAAALALVGMTGYAGAASGRDYISIVGSSTVYPFATVVAEQFGKTTGFKNPQDRVHRFRRRPQAVWRRSVGVAASRTSPTLPAASKNRSWKNASSNGIKEVVEVKIGYDGIVVANSNKAAVMKLTRKDLFLALAKEVPNPNGRRQNHRGQPLQNLERCELLLCPPSKLKCWVRRPPPAPVMPLWSWSWTAVPKNLMSSRH